MKYANRATKIPRKETEVIIGETTFKLREMNGLEKDQYEISVVKRMTINGTAETEIERLLFRSKLIIKCFVDESGARVWQDHEVGDFAVEYGSSVIETLFHAAQELNGMGTTAVEVAEKNSASVPAGASPSDLH